MTGSLIFIRGSPATGKTTLAKKIADEIPGKVSVLIYDEFKWVMTYHQDRTPKDFEIAQKNYLFALENYLQEDYTVITECAWTHLEAEKILDTARKHTKNILRILLVASKETVKHLNTLRPMVIPDEKLMSIYEEVYAHTGEEQKITIDGKDTSEVLTQVQKHLNTQNNQ